MTFNIISGVNRGAGYMINGTNSRPTEADIMTCAHCGTVLYLHDVPGKVNWRRNGAWCNSESKPLCITCGKRAQVHGCESVMKQIERFTESMIKREQLERIAGLEPAPPSSIILPDR